MSEADSTIVFMGSPEFAVPVLRTLHDSYRIAGVVTQPDRPSGRGQTLKPPPVKELALELNLSFIQPPRLREPEALDQLRRWAPDVIVVAAFGQILRQEVLNLPPSGCVNVHASLLPRWRGAAPIHRAVIAGDAVTGISIMRMEAGLDTGPVLMREAVPIGPEDTAGSLHDRLAALGARLIVAALARLGTLVPKPQPEAGVTYADKIDKAEARIDWTAPAPAVDARIRGLSPFPGAWTEIGGERVKLLGSKLAEGRGAPGEVLDDALTIACGQGAVRISRLQRAGRAAQDANAFLRGMAVPAGTRLCARL